MAAEPSSGENKYRVLLRIAEAANGELELAAVLEAVAQVLKPIVPVDAVAVVTVEGDQLRPHALHIPGVEPRSGESFSDLAARGFKVEREQLPGPIPLVGSGTEFVGHTGRAYVSQDLEVQKRFREDERLRTLGVRAYVRAPLVVRDRLIGSISFTRLRPQPFAAEEVSLLEDVSRPVAAAVANSLAYEEIRRLKDQLHAENLVLREEIDQQSMFEEIVGSSPALAAVLARVEKVAATDSTVLITGETGTGKELVARAIHKRSRRAARALIKLNCAALPEALIGSELFGHEKGAFTGAVGQRVGRFELASGGSIFIDEVGELPEEMQVALLRVLQEGEFERVGGTQTIHTDARVIAATNRDLAAAVERGRFRQDLFYRLNVFPIEMPPLRSRKEDVPILVEYFAARYAARLGKRLGRIDKKTRERLVAYSWPGNVRELANVIERAVILSEGDVLRIEETELGGPSARLAPAEGTLRHTIRNQERDLIESVLAESGGLVSGPRGAAARLGIPATTLESKIKRFAIDKYRFRSRSIVNSRLNHDKS